MNLDLVGSGEGAGGELKKKVFDTKPFPPGTWHSNEVVHSKALEVGGMFF